MKNKRKILYVDDEAINLLLFSKLMEPHYKVVTAISGAEALEILDEQVEIDAVITDLRMPKMSGLEFVEKATEEYKSIPYFILSGYAKNEDIQEAITKGLIVGYMQKPFDSELIVEEVEKAVNK